MLRSSASSRLLCLSCTLRDLAALSIQLPGRAIWSVVPSLANAWRTNMQGMLSHTSDSARLTGRSSMRSCQCSCWSSSMRSISTMIKQSVTSKLYLAPPCLPSQGAQTAMAGTNRAVLAAHRPLVYTSLQPPHLSRSSCSVAAEQVLPASSARPAGDVAPLQAQAVDAGPFAGSACSQNSPLHVTSWPARSSPSITLTSSTDPATATTATPTAAPEPAPAPPLQAPTLTVAEASNPMTSATQHTSNTYPPPAPAPSPPATEAPNPTPSAMPHTSSTCPPPTSPAPSPAATNPTQSAKPHTSSTCPSPASLASSPATANLTPSAVPHTSSTCPPPASPAPSPAASELPAASVDGAHSEVTQGQLCSSTLEGGSAGQLLPSAYVHWNEEGAQPAAAAAAAAAAAEAGATEAEAVATTAAGPTVAPSAPTPSMHPQGATGQHTGSTSTSRTACPSNFASLPQAAPTRVVVVGVDPDTSGALAVASWLSYDLNEEVDLNRAQWHMYDVPVAVVELLTKTKEGKSRRRRWLDIIAARKIILQIVQRFIGDSPAYAHAVNQTRHVTHSSPWEPQNSSEMQQGLHFSPPPPQDHQQQQQQQNSMQGQEKHVAGIRSSNSNSRSSSSSSSSSSSDGGGGSRAGTVGLVEEDVPCSELPARGSAGGQAARAGPESGSVARQTEEAAANGSGVLPSGCADGQAASASPEAGSIAGDAKEATHGSGLTPSGCAGSQAARAGPEAGSIAGEAEEAAHGSGLMPSGCADGQPVSSDSEAGSTGGRADAAAPTNVRVDMRAFVEAPPILPNSCSPRTMAQQLYAVGVWYGLLSMAGFQTATVNVMHWKGDLGLKGLDKNDSRLLARQLIPSKTSVLERKKDHGRAEALLITAWAMGCTRPNPMNSKKARKASAAAAKAGSPGSNGLQPIPSFPAYAIDSDGAVVSLRRGLKPLKVKSGCVNIKNEHGARVRVHVEELVVRSREAGGCSLSGLPSPNLGLDSSIDPGPTTSAPEASGGEDVESRPSHLDNTVSLESACHDDSLNNRDSPDLRNSSPNHHACHQPTSAELVSYSSSSSSNNSSSSSRGSDSNSMAENPAVGGSNPAPDLDSHVLDGSTGGAAPVADTSDSPSSSGSGSSSAHGLITSSLNGAGGVSTAEEELPSHLSLPVYLGPVRSLTSTDGYGNPLPYADFDADFTIPEVQAKVPKPKGSRSRKGGRPAAAASPESSSSRGGSRPQVGDSHIAEFLGLLGGSYEEEDEGEEGKEEGPQGPGIAHAPGAEAPAEPKKRGRRKKGVQDGGNGSKGGQMIQGEGNGGAGSEAVGCGHRQGGAGGAEEQMKKGRKKRGSGGIISGNEVSSMGGVSSVSGSIIGMTSMNDSQASSSSGVPSSLTRLQGYKEKEASSPSSLPRPQNPVASSGGDVGSDDGSSMPAEEERHSAAQAAATVSGMLHFPPPPSQPLPGTTVPVLQAPPVPSRPSPSRASASGEAVWSVTQRAPVPYPQPLPGAAGWSVFQPVPVHAERGADGQQREGMAHSLQAVMQLDEQAVTLASSGHDLGAEAPRSTSIRHTSFHSHHIHPSTVQATVSQPQAFSTTTGAAAHSESDSASIMERESEKGARAGRAEKGVKLQ
ncbi:hypothetical protein DUNSADRAFT_17115 [Dunaliella salina]|uniref:Uncharacterized protein n=1 Tax=Dunaliella salina TaxID=3046 RepID=A0ABQ7G2C5_DUNSA|nr:hypothetical protein DUNSADRAFT_17115 [Dunaliella salina]|eukprot:KAF5828753.1 hypothetical protein DUNSADRAFT_17115 [Dunaliella salina]